MIHFILRVNAGSKWFSSPNITLFILFISAVLSPLAVRESQRSKFLLITSLLLLLLLLPSLKSMWYLHRSWFLLSKGKRAFSFLIFLKCRTIPRREGFSIILRNVCSVLNALSGSFTPKDTRFSFYFDLSLCILCCTPMWISLYWVMCLCLLYLLHDQD